MQQKTTNYLKYGISIGFIALLLLIYQVEHNSLKEQTTNTPQKASADFFLGDQPQQQQEHFANRNNDTNATTLASSIINSTCPCPPSIFSTENMTLVRHGENLPVFVPDYLSPMQPDILDKILENRIGDGVLVTVVGYSLRYELYNWMEMLRELEEDYYLVFCTDIELYVHLIVTGFEDKAVMIPDDWIANEQDVSLFRNTSLNMFDHAPRLSHMKTWVLQRLAYTSGIQHVLMVDVNHVMLRARTREYIQALMNVREDTQLIATQDGLDQHTINAGLIMMRTDAKAAKRLLSSTIQIQETEPRFTLQEALNMALDQLDLHVKSGITVLLDVLHFPNGDTYFEKNLSISRGIEPFIIHVNHKFGDERRELLQEHGFWKVNQEHVSWISDQVQDMMYKRKQAESLHNI